MQLLISLDMIVEVTDRDVVQSLGEKTEGHLDSMADDCCSMIQNSKAVDLVCHTDGPHTCSQWPPSHDGCHR